MRASMTSINFMKKLLKNSLVLTFLACAMIILIFFALTYMFIGRGGIPIGWDTPYYLDQMCRASKNGVLAFMHQKGYYRFGYGLLSSFLVTCGISPFLIEMIFPIILCISLVMISGILARRFWKKEKISIFTMLFATTWFAVYRLGADLHASLLALVFLLTSSYFFLIRFDEKSVKSRSFWFLPILMAASFIHPETTIFFAAIFLISAFLSYFRHYRDTTVKYSFRKLILDSVLIVLFMLPSAILYFIQLSDLLTQTSGLIASFPALKITKWIAYMGIFFPIAIPIFFFSFQKNFRKKHCPFDDFVVAWTVLSIAIAIGHYVVPIMAVFSERALILFPTPFVFSIGLAISIKNFPRSATKRANNILETVYVKVFKKERPLKNIFRRTLKVIKVMTIIMIFVSSFTLTAYYVKPSMMVFISQSEYEKITWLSNNYQLSTPPIFVYNDFDESAGELANRNNNWIQFIYGEHYLYLGDIDSLLALKETTFESLESQTYSKYFINNMIRDDVFNKSNLLQHKIIIISDFYLPGPIQTHTNVPLEEIYDGIFIVQIENRSTGH